MIYLLLFFIKISKSQSNSFLFSYKIISDYIMKTLDVLFFISLFNFSKKRAYNIVILDR